MSMMIDWAKNEVKIACKKENPDWDGTDFDYGCNCYISALKAYINLCSEGHSGFSFNITKNILIKLMDGQPLTPITDDDFIINENTILESPEYLKERGLKSSIQCPRMYSLFREESLNGDIKYHDVDRAYCINVENPKDIFHCWLTKIVDELFPITMPYIPTHGKYKIYVYTFLCDKNNGDFDHHGIQKIITPDNKEIEIDNWFFKEYCGEWKHISKEEFFSNMENRIDKNITP